MATDAKLFDPLQFSPAFSLAFHVRSDAMFRLTRGRGKDGRGEGSDEVWLERGEGEVVARFDERWHGDE